MNTTLPAVPKPGLTMRKLPRRLAPLTATLVLGLGACAGTDAAPNSATAPTSAGPESTQSTQSRGSERPSITIDVAGATITARLEDNATARDLATLLPLTLTVFDYNQDEKAADLPRALGTDGVPSSADPAINDLGYYSPQHRLVFYHGDVGLFPGIVRIGQLDPPDMQLIQRQSGNFSVRLHGRTG